MVETGLRLLALLSFLSATYSFIYFCADFCFPVEALYYNTSGTTSGLSVASKNSPSKPSQSPLLILAANRSASQFPMPFTPQSIVTVCPAGCNYALISQAVANAQDYELIEVQAGSYTDCAILGPSVPHIWLRGVGGMVLMNGKVCNEMAALVAQGAQTVVDNFEFTKMRIPCALGENAVGIRTENGDLVVRNSYFHDSQGGILTDNNPAINVTVQNSVFARLGVDQTLCAENPQNYFRNSTYIGKTNNFIIQNSILTKNQTGVPVKSRARKSIIECNQIVNGYDSAYHKNAFLVDLPNGGEEYIYNNVMAQGPHIIQEILIAYGAEIDGASREANPTQSLKMSGNILINDAHSGWFLYMFHPTATPAQVSNNVFVGAGKAIAGSYSSSVNESGDQSYTSRSAAAFPVSGLPTMPSVCTSPIGNIQVQ